VDLVKALLGAANENAKDLIQFLLNTGFRDEEAAYAMWSDINFQQGSINVYAEPTYGWTPKDGEAREQDIVLGEKFLERMKAGAA
jgi:integrase